MGKSTYIDDKGVVVVEKKDYLGPTVIILSDIMIVILTFLAILAIINS